MECHSNQEPTSVTILSRLSPMLILDCYVVNIANLMRLSSWQWLTTDKWLQTLAITSDSPSSLTHLAPTLHSCTRLDCYHMPMPNTTRLWWENTAITISNRLLVEAVHHNTPTPHNPVTMYRRRWVWASPTTLITLHRALNSWWSSKIINFKHSHHWPHCHHSPTATTTMNTIPTSTYVCSRRVPPTTIRV